MCTNCALIADILRCTILLREALLQLAQKKAQSRGIALKIPPKEEVLEECGQHGWEQLKYARQWRFDQALLLRCGIPFLRLRISLTYAYRYKIMIFK